MSRVPGALVRHVLLAAWTAAAVAACGMTLPGLGPQPTGPLEQVSCPRFHRAACQEFADHLHAETGQVARRIELQCSLPACGRSGGSGTARMTLWSGDVRTVPFEYQAADAALPAPRCMEIDAELCGLLWPWIHAEIRPAWSVASITVECALATAACMDGGGVAEITVTMRDGSTESWEHTWQGTLARDAPALLP